MRMWMVPPILLCKNHLLGEHNEIHMLSGSIRKGKSIQGFLDNFLLAPRKIFARHKELVNEMIERGYNHKSPLPEVDVSIYPEIEIAEENSIVELRKRCEKCRTRIDNLQGLINLTKRIVDLPKETQSLVNKHFWELV